MNKKKVILGSCGVIVCLIGGGLFAVNHFVDRKMILEQLYTSVEKQTGRKLALKDLEIHFFPWPEIQASQISLSNMPNGKNPHFITAGHLKADLNIWSLWQQKIHFKSIELSNVQIHLERNALGEKNWDFQPIETAKNEADSNTPKTPHRKWKWQFNNVLLDNVECWYDDASTHKNAHLLFTQAELNQLESNKVKFNINGSHHKADFTIAGRISHFDELLENDGVVSQPAKFQVNLTEYIRKQNIGNIRISGTLKSLVQAKGYDVTIRGTVLNLNYLNQLFPHAKLPSIENITLSMAVKDVALDSDAVAKPEIDQLQLHTGKITAQFLPDDLQLTSTEIVANDLNSVINTQIVGQLYGTMFRWSGDLGQLKALQESLLFQTDKTLPVTGNLSSANYNLELKGSLGGKASSLNTKFNLLNYTGNLTGLGDINAQNIKYIGKITAQFPLTLAFLKHANKEDLFNITTRGKLSSNSVKINQFHFDDFSTNVDWKKQQLTLTQLQLANRQSNFKGDITYSAESDSPTVNIKIKSSSFPMKWIEDYFQIANIYTGQVTVMGELLSQGHDWQEWQRNLTGKLGISGTDGRLEAEGLKHYIGQAASTLPLKKSLSTQCLAIRTQISPDSLYFDTLTLQTDQFALNGQGDFNIPEQKLNLHFVPDVRLGVISASAPIRIGGTLSKPYTTFDMNKNKVFSLNINALSKSAPPTNYCISALDKARNPLGISAKK